MVVEIKNLNSFKVVQKAIDFEITRQQALLESGEKVVQETRGWNDKKEITFNHNNFVFMMNNFADFLFDDKTILKPFAHKKMVKFTWLTHKHV